VAFDVDAFVDLRDVQNGLNRLLRAGGDLRKVFRAVRADMRADQSQHVRDQRGPDGTWKPLAASTIARRKQRPGKRGRRRIRPLRARSVKKLGRLPRAYTITIKPRSIAAKSRVPWSGAHQPRGGTSTRVGHNASLPARAFLWASTKLLVRVARATVDYMTTVWKSR